MTNEPSEKQDCKLIETDALSVRIAIDGQVVILQFVHRPTGQVWADGPVIYRVQTSENSRDVITNRLESPAVQVDDRTLIVTGQAQHLAVRLGGFTDLLESTSSAYLTGLPLSTSGSRVYQTSLNYAGS